MGIRIVRARPDEASRLTSIAHRAKRHWGYPEHYIALWRDELTLTRAFIRTHHVYKAELRGRVRGFYALTDHGERMELEHLWVDPRCVDAGVGRALLSHAVETASLNGAVAIDISADPKAAGFYEKMGAKQVGRIPEPVAGKERYVPRMALELAAARPCSS